MPSKTDHNPLAPRYWGTKIGLMVLSVICRLLPYRLIVRIGARLGRLTMRLSSKRRHIAKVNIGLCFPDYSDEQRQLLLERHFESVGIGLLTTGMAWWVKDESLREMVQLEGLERLTEAAKEGKGVILLSAHFTDLEISGRLLTLFFPFSVMYRQHENPAVEEVFRLNREAHFTSAIKKNDVKQMIKVLKQGGTVWYAPDQSYSSHNSALVPFFNVPASTNLATSRLAKVTGAKVLPFFGYRQPDGRGFRLVIQPPLEDFPTNDPVDDAKRINSLIETAVTQAPEQYFWLHRRFKKRKGHTDPYTGSKRLSQKPDTRG